MAEANQPDPRIKRSEIDGIILALLDNQMRMIIAGNQAIPEGERTQEQQEAMNGAFAVLYRIAETHRDGIIEDTAVDPLDEVIVTTRSTDAETTAAEIIAELGVDTMPTPVKPEVGHVVYAPTPMGTVLCLKITRIEEEPLQYYGMEPLSPVELLLPKDALFSSQEDARAAAKVFESRKVVKF